MAKIARTWQAESFDSVSIKAHNCKMDIEGIDGDLVELNGEFSDHRGRDLIADRLGQQLKIQSDHSQFTLKIPWQKFWLISIFSGHGDISINNIQSRLRIMMGRGDIRVENFRGILDIISGHGNFYLKHFSQILTEVPEFASSPPDQPLCNDAASPWYRFEGKENYLEDWGQEMGEKIGWWVQEKGRFFEQTKFMKKDTGISLQTGEGDVEIEDITAKASVIKLGKGDLTLNSVAATNLAVNIGRGEVECKSVIPSGDWMIKTTKGNVRLSLPSNIGVRLDMATRQGNIESEIPLVRVTRQGPESYLGMRMVGATVSGESSLPQLEITAVHGNIKIESESPLSEPFIRPAEGNNPQSQPEDNKTLIPLSQDRQDESESSKKDKTEKPAPAAKPAVYDTQLAILKALREGQISVSEADRLLLSSGT